MQKHSQDRSISKNVFGFCLQKGTVDKIPALLLLYYILKHNYGA